MDVRGLVQTTLDNALYNYGVHVFWNRMHDTADATPDEYIVYMLDGDSNEGHADDTAIIKAAEVSVRYYYRLDMLNNSSGRDGIKLRETQISNALNAAGFIIPNGSFDIGDVDDIGFGVIVFEAELWRAV